MLSLAGLLVPIYVAPVIPALIAVLVGIGLPKPRNHTARPEAVRVSPSDRRMWPFLVTGFGLYLALAIVRMTAGFLVQDRLRLTAARTGPVTSLVVQAVIVPRLGWTPARLIRVGTIVMTVGMVLVAFAPTLAGHARGEGPVVGLVGSSSALAFMLGPLLLAGLTCRGERWRACYGAGRPAARSRRISGRMIVTRWRAVCRTPSFFSSSRPLISVLRETRAKLARSSCVS